MVLSGGKQRCSNMTPEDQTMPTQHQSRPAPDDAGTLAWPNALQISEIRYRRLFEAARDGILILDAGTRRITDANPFMSELLGYEHKELLGKELWQIGLLKDEAASREAFRIL